MNYSQDIQIRLISEDTVAIVPIQRIRIANYKILEGQHYKDVARDLSEIIKIKSSIITEKEKLYNIQIEESKVCRSNIEDLAIKLENSEKKAYKFKKQRNIFSLISGSSILLLVIAIL